MIINYWLERSSIIIENEVLLAKDTNGDTKKWYNKMPKIVSAVFSEEKNVSPPSECLLNPIGKVHTIRMMKIGIEGILKSPKKYHKYPLYLLYYPQFDPNEPFWVVLYRVKK